MKDLFIKHRSKVAYLLVGGWNTLFGYGSFALLYMFFSGRLHPVVILTISYVLSITNAFIGYKMFVFRTKGNILLEYLRFYVVYGVSFAINLILLPVFMNLILLDAYASQALIMILTVIGSYIFHKRFTFRTHGDEDKR